MIAGLIMSDYLLLKVFDNVFSNLLHLLFRECHLMLEVEVVYLVERYKVNVRMRHFQTHHCYTNLNTRNSGFDGGSYSLGKSHIASELVVVDVEDVAHLFLGYYEGVTLLNGIDIQESEKLIVLCNLVARNLAVDDTCKYCCHN